MTTFDDFSVGNRVAHIANGDGIVTMVDDAVCVTFDRKGANGKHWFGKYDREWFRLHPTYLFHRSGP